MVYLKLSKWEIKYMFMYQTIGFYIVYVYEDLKLFKWEIKYMYMSYCTNQAIGFFICSDFHRQNILYENCKRRDHILNLY
jgi:hypothetical protein